MGSELSSKSFRGKMALLQTGLDAASPEGSGSISTHFTGFWIAPMVFQIGADLSQVQGEAGQAARRLTTAGLEGQRVGRRRGQPEKEWTAERQLDFLAVALFLLTLAGWSEVLYVPVDEKILFKLQC